MRFLVALSCALFVAGCSPGAENYADAGAVAAALRAEGIPCDIAESGGSGDLVDDRGECGSGTAGYTIFVFDREEELDRWLRVGAGLGDVVVGPNWAIDPGGDADAVAEALGGEIR